MDEVIHVVKLVMLVTAAVVVTVGALLFVALAWRDLRARSAGAPRLRPSPPPLEPRAPRRVIGRIGPTGRA